MSGVRCPPLAARACARRPCSASGLRAAGPPLSSQTRLGGHPRMRPGAARVFEQSAAARRHAADAELEPRQKSAPASCVRRRSYVDVPEVTSRELPWHDALSVTRSPSHALRHTLSVARSPSHALGRTLAVARSPLHARRCTLAVARWPLHAGRRTLAVARWPSHAGRRTLSVARSPSHALRRTLGVARSASHALRRTLAVARWPLHAPSHAPSHAGRMHINGVAVSA
jgi:hypothetical protein